MLNYGLIVEQAPLQTYGAALAFSPAKSEVKIQFWTEKSPYISSVKGIKENWNACQQTLEGHNDSVSGMAFSADGGRLASASRDGTVRLWNTATGKCERTLEGHNDWVNGVAFSIDGGRLASASDDKTVQLWNTATGKCERTLEADTIIKSFSFSTDGQYLQTDRGLLDLYPGASHISPHQVQSTPNIFISENWVNRNGQRLLWLPPDYRAIACSAFYKNLTVLGYASGQVTFLEFASSEADTRI